MFCKNDMCIVFNTWTRHMHILPYLVYAFAAAAAPHSAAYGCRPPPPHEGSPH